MLAPYSSFSSDGGDMRTNRDDRGVFLLGALIGVLGGFIVGSVATAGIGDRVADLTRRLTNRLFDEQEAIRFELLGQ